MPRSRTHILLALALLLTSEVWAIGLGDIRLDSALNEPLRAQIQLLSATAEEIANLEVVLASKDTFNRYGLDRPFYLQDIEFEVVRSGREDGNYIRVISTSPMTEPFLTFLVEASWSRGRLLREYTVLLDPPTFAPPAARQAPAQVTAPERSTATDSGRIERAPQPTPPPADAPVRQPRPQARPAQDTSYDDTAGGDYVVRRGDSLWGIASNVRPDPRLSMNQTMLSIYEANPQAFGGNINLLRAGARLRIPSADEIYRIDRGDATSEVQRQYSAWDASPGATAAPEPAADTRPSLTLVPPDEEPVGVGTGAQPESQPEPVSREQQLMERIAELEDADIPEQQSLIQIRDNELAQLRRELANIRGEVYDPAADGPFVEDADDAGVAGDESPQDQVAEDAAETAAGDSDDSAADQDLTGAPADTTTVITRRDDAPSFLDQVIGWVTSVWALIGAAVLVAFGLLFWFMRRGGETEAGGWKAPLDSDEIGRDAQDALSRTETLPAPARDNESFVVVEQDPAIRLPSDTVEVEAAPSIDTSADTGQFAAIEDTFSSDTAINLDQSDPIAEADFHMAYGLYDQAADLINGALEVEPERQDLLTKLCEIYFVWGNRDAFVDAAQRLRGVSGGGSADWDKIVIMGQQIAGDDAMFAGAGVTGVTREVDLSFGSDSGETGILDMDFGAAGGGDNVIDFDSALGDDDSGFMFGEDVTAEVPSMDADSTNEMPTVERPVSDPTVEMPAAESTVETPTIEEPFAGFDGTAELPEIADTIDEAIDARGLTSEETAEIDLDDLGLNIGDLDETHVSALHDDDDYEGDATEIAPFDELDSTGTRELLIGSADATAQNPALDPDSTSQHRALDPESTSQQRTLDPESTSQQRTLDPESTSQQRTLDPESTSQQRTLDPESTSQQRTLDPESTSQQPSFDPDSTSQQPSFDPDSTSQHPGPDPSATGLQPALDPDASALLKGLDIEDTSASGMRLAADETGQNPLLDSIEDTIDESLFDETASTPIMSDDQTVEVGSVFSPIDDDDATMLAPDLDDDDFEFARTEALSPEAFLSDRDLGATGELPSIGSTDVDLDLDDLTAALEVNEFTGDTVEPRGDDATAEHPRPSDFDDMAVTQEISSEDLHEARTMTEVGTKLDLARAYVDMGDPAGARSILEEVLDEGDEGQRQQAQQLLDSLPS